MKKLTAISILLVLLSVTAFAQLKAEFEANFTTDAVFFEKATGDMADADTVKGATNIFNHGSQGLNLALTYSLPNAEAFIKFDFAPLVAGVFKGGATANSILASGVADAHVKGNAWVFEGYMGTGGGGGLVNDYEFTKDTNIGNALGGYGAIKFPTATVAGAAFIGSQYAAITYDAKGAPLAEENNDGKAFKALSGTGTTGTDDLSFGGPYTSLGINLNAISVPIKIQVGSNVAFFKAGNVMHTDTYNVFDPATSADSINAAFRVSGGKIADFISFDVVYRIKGGDDFTRLTNNNWNMWANGYVKEPLMKTPNQVPADGGGWDNEIGAYVGLDIFKGLGLGVGYTAAFRVDEMSRVNRDEEGATIEYVNPVFSGIDLRVKFTGIDKLAISLANNLSFAFQRGEKDDVMVNGGRYIQPMGYWLPAWNGVTGRNAGNRDGMPAFRTYYTKATDKKYRLDGNGTTTGGNMWNTDQNDSWFALHNNLGVSYQITDRASVDVAIANRLGIYDFVLAKDEVFAKWTTDDFQIGLKGTFDLSPNVSFGAGLTVGVWGMTAEMTSNQAAADAGLPTLDTAKIGEVKLAIPLNFTVKW